MHAGLLRQEVIECQQPARTIAREVAAHDPDVLAGYPSSTSAALAQVRRLNLPLNRLRLVLAGGETMTPALLGALKRYAAPASVYSVYGAHETNLLAQECPSRGGYHLIGDAAIVEVLRPDGLPAEIGEEGEVVVTALHSFAMPFIRYRLGDIVRRGPDRCPCGVEVACLDSVLGRSIDLFVAPDGDRYHPYAISRPASLLAGDKVDGIRVIQHAPQRIEVILQATGGLPPDYSDQLSRAVQEALGFPIEVDVHSVQRLEPESTGKFRPYVCRVDSPRA